MSNVAKAQESKPATPVPRKRGLGPDCPLCGSVMYSNGGSITRGLVYLKCQNPDCGHTDKQANPEALDSA